ncbi:SymE family type I addiction module toxin [Enterobacteriaceae bacterium C34A]
MMPVNYVRTRHIDPTTLRTTHYTCRASLRLNGRWMEEAGFTTGTKLDVRVMPGDHCSANSNAIDESAEKKPKSCLMMSS